MSPLDWRADPLLVTLGCAAVDPALSGVLLFDATPERALAAAHTLALLRGLVEQRPSRVILLPSSSGEEEVWGSPILAAARKNQASHRRRGVLSTRREVEAEVVLVPDLARISLAAARAAVVHAGADAAVLERDGESAAWRPDQSWVAALARAEVGEVSPHLLDRFPLRVTVPAALTGSRATEIRAWALSAETSLPVGAAVPVPAELRARLDLLPRQLPGVGVKVLPLILSYFPAGETPGMRRPLALARFARALAALDGEDAVRTSHVREAARLAGLRSTSSTAVKPPAEPTPVPSSAKAPTPEAPTAAPRPAVAAAYGIEAGGLVPAPPEPAEEPAEDNEQVFASITLPSPYPEDSAPPTREAYSLRFPALRGRDTAGAGGAPVGTRRAQGTRDLAMVSTVLEAAKFQRVRPALPGGGAGIRILPDDLRAYRRLPAPQEVLALVLDYTSLAGSRWQEALLPHLTWAYVSRARVYLVQVGARGAPEPLRAEALTARNLLAPRIRAALEEGPGSATPLAHGLDLAERTLRHAFQQGRERVRGGLLVVVTDGRGNVPLEASFTGSLPGRVLREGVEDALHAARRIGELKDLARVVLHPRPQQYPRMPLDLAEAMGATAQAMELLDPVVEGA